MLLEKQCQCGEGGVSDIRAHPLPGFPSQRFLNLVAVRWPCRWGLERATSLGVFEKENLTKTGLIINRLMEF